MTGFSRRKVIAGSAAIAATVLPRYARAQSNAPIKIGLSVPTSGVLALVGREVQRGVEMYLGSIGSNVAGRPIELIQEDETLQVATGVAKAHKLLERDNVHVLIGGAISSIIYAVMPLIAERKVPYLVVIGGGSEITRKKSRSPFVYRSSYNIWAQTYPFGKYLAKNGVKKVHIFCPDYVAGREFAEAFATGFTEDGGVISGQTFAPLSSPDFVPYLTKISDEKPDGIFGFWASAAAQRYFSAVEQLGISKNIKQFVSGYAVDHDVLPHIKNAAAGAVSVSGWNASLPAKETQDFVATYTQKFKAIPSISPVWGWDAARAVCTAIEKVGGEVENSERFAKAFNGLSFVSPRGPVEFDRATHDIVQDLYIQETVAGNPLPTNKIITTIPRARDPFPDR